VRLRGQAPRGERRLIDYAPHGHWKTITFVGGLRQTRHDRTFLLGSHERSDVSRLCEAMPCPDPQARRVVLMDHLPVRKVAGVAEAIEAADTTLIYFPKYLRDPNPIELAFSKLKDTILWLLRRVGCIVTDFSPQQCRNFFRRAGYART
jgi:hypothetical protein